jgi:hypothetical protein
VVITRTPKAKSTLANNVIVLNIFLDFLASIGDFPLTGISILDIPEPSTNHFIRDAGSVDSKTRSATHLIKVARNP